MTYVAKTPQPLQFRLLLKVTNIFSPHLHIVNNSFLNCVSGLGVYRVVEFPSGEVLRGLNKLLIGWFLIVSDVFILNK